MPSPSASFDGVRVLVVDPHDDGREMLAYALQERGAAVLHASTLPAAFEALDGLQPDVLIVEAFPEDLSAAASLVAALRARAALRGATSAAIAYTAHAFDMDRKRFLAAGFDAHVPKPKVLEVLLQLILELLRKRRASGRDSPPPSPPGGP